MTYFKAKSESNLKSAGILISNNHHASSVHCSYYSCVQLILHIFINDFKKTEDQINQESQLGSKNENGYHNWIRNQILREFFTRDYNAGTDFNKFIGNLMNARVKADYKNISIEAKHSKQALSYANTIIELLKESFAV